MDLKCSICHKDFDEFERMPRLVPECGHSFCQKCIRNGLIEKRNVFTCPIDNMNHYLRKDLDEIPKNMILIKAIRENRQHNLARSRHNFVQQYSSNTQKIENMCLDHQKPKQFRCRFDGKLVCSHCALFGQHKGHDLQAADKLNENQLKRLISKLEDECQKLQCCVKDILDTPSSLAKNLEKARKDLKLELKQIFKSYHQIISRKEAQLEKELEQMLRITRKNMTAIEDEVQQNLKTARMIRQQQNMRQTRVNLIVQQVGSNHKATQTLAAEIDDLMGKIQTFKPLVLRLDDDIKNRCREVVTTNKNKMRGYEYFKIHEQFPNVFDNQQKKAGKSIGKSRQDSFSVDLNRSKVTKPEISVFSPIKQETHKLLSLPADVDLKQDHMSLEALNKLRPKQPQNRPETRETTKETSYQKRRDSRQLPPKRAENLNQNQMDRTVTTKKSADTKKKLQTTTVTLKEKNQSQQRIEDRKTETMSRDKLGTTQNIRQNSPKRTKKQLKFEARQKVDHVLSILEKQPGPNLQLIGLQIKDYFIPEIFEFIQKSGRKYGLIKFVKNQLTNEGMSMILQHLRNYNFAHTLNLTSNSLTEDCLDSIMEFSGHNKALRNFYLTGNNINMVKIRQKKRMMQDMGLNIHL